MFCTIDDNWAGVTEAAFFTIELNRSCCICSPSWMLTSACVASQFSFSTWKSSDQWNLIQGGELGGGACPANGDGCGLRTVSWTASTTQEEKGDPFLLCRLPLYRPPVMRKEGWASMIRFERRIVDHGMEPCREDGKERMRSRRTKWRNDLLTTEEDGW